MEIQQRIRQILDAEAAAIASIDVNEAFERAVLCLRDVRGKVLTTGMGKGGHIARKFASTLCSTGTPAFYVHPGESSHGDLGSIAAGDCVVAFSTSGKTREVIDMLGQGKRLGLSTIIGVTSHPDSELRLLSDIVVDMGVIGEPCVHGLTPSASTTAMLAIADAIALTLMETKRFTRDDFGARHHGGYLGRVARCVSAQDAMIQDVCSWR